MIRAEVNAGDFMWEVLRGNLNVDNNHKCRWLSAIIGELECMTWDLMQHFFYIDLSHCKERQSFVIPVIADNGIDYIYYNLLSLKLPSVFCLSLCLNVNFEKMLLYSTMLNL